MRVGAELLEGGVHRILDLALLDALDLELSAALDGLVLELVDGVFAVGSTADAKDVAGGQRGVRHEGVVRLLGHAHDVDGSGDVRVDVAQVHVRELDARHDLELLLHAATALDRVLEDHRGAVLVHLAVREDELGHAGEGLADADLVALVDLAVEAEVLVDEMGVVALAHLLEELRQAVRDEAVALREQVRPHLGHLPARQVAVDAVEEGAVVVELGWEGVEQVGGLEDIGDGVVDVALEDHGGLGVVAVGSAAKGAVGHVALHDLDGVHVFEVHAGDLVEGDRVPVAHEAHGPVARVVAGEELGRGGLAA